LTAERFVTGPDGARAYRSGDRAVRDERGQLAYLGRIDDQIKVRGFRIEPHEIEVCLSAHPAVAGAVVTSKDYGEGDVRLVAYVQPAPNGGAPVNGGGAPVGQQFADALRQHAAAHLPAHLRPTEYLAIEEIPMTPQGKADRAALTESGQRDDSGAPDRSDIEQAVLRIVLDVLQRESIGPDQDMFDVGATSLAFIRIVTQVNEDFGVQLTGSELGDTASVSRLAAAVLDARQTSAQSAA
jgi:acyl carrier protein